MSSEPIPTPTPSPPTAPARPLWDRRKLLLFAVVALVTTGVVGCLVWWSSRPDTARSEALQAASEGRFFEAEPQLKAALERKPDDAEVAEALARGYIKAEKPAEAESSLTRWVELRPDDREARRLRFEFYRKTKEIEKAYPDGRRLLELEPADAALRRTLVSQAFSLGLFAEAESLCNDSLRDQPGDRGLRSLLAEIRRARGDTAGAGSVLDQLLKEFPTHTPAMLARGILYLETGEPEKAAPLLREVLRLDKSRQRTAGYQLVIALERTGQTEEAKRVAADVRKLQDVEVFGGAINTQPDNLDVRVRLAERLLADGHTQDGVETLQAVLALNPGHRAAHLALATHYDKQGQHQRAAEHRKLAGPTP